MNEISTTNHTNQSPFEFIRRKLGLPKSVDA